jgi:hypothetical protein
MPDRSRIPPKPSLFHAYMMNTDNHQLGIDEVTGNPRWMKWQWTEEESEQWSDFRKRSEQLYLVYADKNFKNTSVKEQMHSLIRETNRYDHGRSTGHQLLLAVKINGNMEDWQKFRIKQGTSLEKDPVRRSGEVGTLKPVLTVRKIDHGYHMLSVRNSESALSRARPEGMAGIRVYRFIGLQPPASVKEYQFAGPARRGIFRSLLSDLTLDSNKKYYAWYIARYVSTKGMEGSASEPVQAVIV